MVDTGCRLLFPLQIIQIVNAILINSRHHRFLLHSVGPRAFVGKAAPGTYPTTFAVYVASVSHNRLLMLCYNQLRYPRKCIRMLLITF